MKWEEGRQGTGYLKHKLFRICNLDCYLLKYPKGSYIPPHKDPVEEGYRHVRINYVYHRAEDGGNFICDDVIWSIGRRVVCFRPDKVEHSVLRVEKGTRYVFSIGWKI